MKKVNQIYGAAFVLLVFQIRDLESLHCHKCLAMECKGNSEVCESVRVFIAQQLRSYYQFGEKYLEECPDHHDSSGWSKREGKNSFCQVSRDSDATCALGRIRVTTIPSPSSGAKKIISHATIMGCATMNLLKTLSKAYQECYSITLNSTAKNNSPFEHYLEVEQCSRLSDYCYTVDYCVAPASSVVKSYRTNDSSFEYGTIVAIIVTVAVLFLVLIAAQWCKTIPLNRLINYSPPQTRVIITNGHVQPI